MPRKWSNEPGVVAATIMAVGATLFILIPNLPLPVSQGFLAILALGILVASAVTATIIVLRYYLGGE